jgi:uncharacterized protein YkwD
MAALVLLTFVGTNMQALLWQSSDWLVSTVLPAVVVDLTNDERADLAAAPLQRNTLLDQAAQQKAQHMAANEYFAHFAPDGTTPWSFFKTSGYVYAHAGENLAIHFTDSTEVVEAWMQSPAHRKNIVDTKYTEIGVGTAKGKFDGYDTVYVVQLFGTPAVPPAAEPATPPVPDITPTPIAAVEDDPVDDILSPTDLAALQAQIQAVSGAVAELADTNPVEEAVTTTEPVVLAADAPEASVASNQLAAEELAPVAPPTAVSMSKANTVVISTELATSSGLAVATLIEPSRAHAGATIAAVATQPNVLLDIVYTGIVGVIIILLVASLLGEARRLHVVQVAYSIALLFAIGGLWYVHALLTSGAVIV